MNSNHRMQSALSGELHPTVIENLKTLGYAIKATGLTAILYRWWLHVGGDNRSEPTWMFSAKGYKSENEAWAAAERYARTGENPS
jgi:hypothetical protein